MAIADALLPEYDHEVAVTRTLLERVPAKPSWKPHAKSMELGRLSMHLAEIPQWAGHTLTKTELDLAPVDGKQQYVSKPYVSTEALLAEFDANAKEARAVIASTPDAAFFVPWSLKKAGHVEMTMPRIAVLRSFVMNHMIHHRGQLSVYLRLNDVPVPSMYGPTADTR